MKFEGKDRGGESPTAEISLARVQATYINCFGGAGKGNFCAETRRMSLPKHGTAVQACSHPFHVLQSVSWGSHVGAQCGPSPFVLASRSSSSEVTCKTFVARRVFDAFVLVNAPRPRALPRGLLMYTHVVFLALAKCATEQSFLVP